MLSDKILMPPTSDAARLVIVSGYGSPAMAHRHKRMLDEADRGDVCVEVILGMTVREGLPQSAHRSYQQLAEASDGRFTFAYVCEGAPVHAKVYVWLGSEGEVVRAFAGSANYSQTAFFDPGYGEAMEQVEDGHVALAFVEEVRRRALSCLEKDVADRVRLVADTEWYRGRKPSSRGITTGVAVPRMPRLDEFDSVELSLLAKDGETHRRAGLNWGQRDNRNPDQAYIPVPRDVARSGFFPPRGRHFTLFTDDGFAMDCVIAQDGDKAIQSSESNAILGRYFRERIGLSSGDFVRTEDLRNYGRTSVEVYRLDDETYLMDFSAD